MARASLAGLPLRQRAKRVPPATTVTDLVKRDFRRDGPNQLWVTDITEHPTREGKLYCCVVLDAYSRRAVGWSIDSRQRADLATAALGMAIDARAINGQIPGGIIHADHGTQFTSWTFTERARRAGLLPSPGTIGDPYDNAVIESFWGRMQTELLNRQRWKTGSNWRTRSSSTSRASTTDADATPPSAGWHPYSSKTPTTTAPQTPHPCVRETGGTSEQLGRLTGPRPAHGSGTPASKQPTGSAPGAAARSLRPDAPPDHLKPHRQSVISLLRGQCWNDDPRGPSASTLVPN
jgi:transposase InsO family protein